MSKRTKISYSQQELNIINDDKQKFIEESIKIIQPIYENQQKIANDVFKAFSNRNTIISLVIAKTQSGKTGSMHAIISKYVNDMNDFIPVQNIYIITGLSSIEWKSQTIERIPSIMRKHIFHRYELLKTFVDEIKKKKNVLIIIDEVQIAAKKNQTIDKTFKEIGLSERQLLYDNDIKIVLFTATPDGLVYDLKDVNNGCVIIKANPGNNYISAHDLFLAGRVKQYKSLCFISGEKTNEKITLEEDEKVIENIKELKSDVDIYQEPRYHIIRTKKGKGHIKTIDFFYKIFKRDLYDYIKYDIKSGIIDINDILKKEPKKHTIIFIKDKLRCSKTLYKKYLGVLYERYTSIIPDDNVIIQGLIGRDTGYDNNGTSICYTNIDSIIRYEQLWNSDFLDDTIIWRSKTTKMKKGIVKSYNTFTSDESPQKETQEIEPIILKFNDIKSAKLYYKENLQEKFKGYGPSIRKLNKDGYYESLVNNKKKVYSCEEIYKVRKKGLLYKNFLFHPCYRDINDKSTLEFWLITK